jgi:hypothetical protein
MNLKKTEIKFPTAKISLEVWRLKYFYKIFV